MKNLALEAVVQPVITGLGYEFVGLEQLSYGSGNTIRIFIDGPTGVTLDDCSKVSRQLDSVLDVETDLVRGAYNLEVSSPGVDRKLFNFDQYQRFIGKKVRIVLHAQIDGRKKYEGKLTAAADQQVSLEVDGSTINFDYADIAQANVVDEQARL